MIEVNQQVQDQMAIIASQLVEVGYGDGVAAIQKLVQTIGAERFEIDTTRENVNFQFMFPKGKLEINYVRIELNGSDLYNIYYGAVLDNQVTYKKEVSDLYSDSLRTSFELTTGHRLS